MVYSLTLWTKRWSHLTEFRSSRPGSEGIDLIRTGKEKGSVVRLN